MRGAIVTMKFAHCETYNEIAHHFVKINFNSTETVVFVINELFDHYQISWEFVVCVFVLIDIIMRKEGRIALENEEHENYRVNVNSKIASPLSEILDGAVVFCVFFNGGWSSFLSSSNYSVTAYEQTAKCGEILQGIRDFIVNLYLFC